MTAMKTLIQSVFRDILLGDDARGKASGGGLFAHWGRIRGAEEGQINLVSAIIVLGFVVLIGLIGNSGHAVKEKIELQNAADATAYSSALWMARGMNAITTTNHLMGEAAAVIMTFDALGGREVGERKRRESSRQLNSLLQDWQKENVPANYPVYGTPFVPDQQLIRLVSELVAGDDGVHTAHATIYDAKLTLKWALNVIYLVKKLANLGMVPTPVYPATSVVAIGIHLAMTPLIVKIVQEWLFLEVIETGLTTVKRSGAIDVIEEQVIPILSLYGDWVAGRGLEGVNLPVIGAVDASPVNRSIDRTLKQIEQRYNVDQALVFPRTERPTLPIRPEPAPTRGRDKPHSAWTGNDWPPWLRTVLDFKNQIESKLAWAKRFLAPFKAVGSFLRKLTPPLPTITVGGVQIKLDTLSFPSLPNFENYEGFQLDPRSQGKGTTYGYKDNPAFDSLHRMDVRSMKRSQWVRATYPYVDSFRAPIRGFFRSTLPASNAATYFTHWTNRYTLDVAYRIRTRRRFGRKPKMYVMRDPTRAGKKREQWTGGAPDERRLAERYFTVLVVVHRRKREAPIGPIIYRNAAKEGHYAVAQAMFYNANGTGPDKRTRQPNTGWDTLNWKPPMRAWEWGDHDPSNGSASDALRPFVGGLRATRESRVKINWQAKLVPVTRTRLGDAIADPRSAGSMRPILRRMRKYHNSLVTH